MKVSDIMHRSIITVTEETSMKEVGRLIFSLGIAGIPVIKGKKLVGIVTEEDILARMHPTIQEVIEDYANASDFESMARKMHGLLDDSVKEIMHRNVTSITPETPLMKAHSIMLLNKFSRLPIVNDKNDLVGIISQGDVFRAILKNEIPKIEKERYAGFISQYYDQMVNWEKRFDSEFPTLFKLFKENNVKKILDLGVWTGEYTMGLIKRSEYSVLGLDNSSAMIKISNSKKAKLAKGMSKRINFALTDYANISAVTKEKFDAAICMGNSLPYIPVGPGRLFKEMTKVLNKNAIVVMQVLNFEKILLKKDRLISFDIQKSVGDGSKEQLSIEFFDHKNKNALLHNTIIFDNDGMNWIYKGITTVEVCNIRKEDIEISLKNAGFKNISISGNTGEYQGEFGELSLKEEFKPLESDFLNVVATKG